jgi:hypothetical protein
VTVLLALLEDIVHRKACISLTVFVILDLYAEMDLPQQLRLIVKVENNVQLEDTAG